MNVTLMPLNVNIATDKLVAMSCSLLLHSVNRQEYAWFLVPRVSVAVRPGQESDARTTSQTFKVTALTSEGRGVTDSPGNGDQHPMSYLRPSCHTCPSKTCE